MTWWGVKVERRERKRGKERARGVVVVVEVDVQEDGILGVEGRDKGWVGRIVEVV